MKKRPHKNQKYIAYVVSSIDGVISLKKKKLPDWTSREDQEFFQKSLEKFDAVVVGLNTYEAAKERLQKRNAFVLTHEVKTTKQEGNVTFVNPANVDLRKLLESYKTVAVLGGSEAYSFMLNEGLLDEIFLTIEPLVFGRGIRIFADKTKHARLRLLSAKKLNPRGTILLHYQVDKSVNLAIISS